MRNSIGPTHSGNQVVSGYYYICPNGNCTPTSVALSNQAPNVVGLMSSDNNGLVISLPSVSHRNACFVARTRRILRRNEAIVPREKCCAWQRQQKQAHRAGCH